MTTGLRTSDQKLLRELVERRNPALAHLLKTVSECSLGVEDAETLQMLVGDELLEVGIGADDIPTAYGLQLESLIDELGRAFIFTE